MSVHAQAQPGSTQKHCARTARHEARLLSTTLRAHAPKQPTTPHSRATPAPTQAHRRCPRATARSSTVNLPRSAPSRHCPAGGKGAIRQTHAAVAKHKARTRERPQIPPPPRTRAQTHVYTRTECQPLSLVLDTGRSGGHGGRALDGGPAHTHKATDANPWRSQPTRSREAPDRL